MQALVRSAAVVLLVLSLGLHWALLQTVAWTGMLIDNSRAGSFQEALAKTLDGKHPCCLCKAIAAGKKSGPTKEFAAQFQKLEFPPGKENPVMIAPSGFQLLPQATTFTDSLAQKPPTPPPRGGFA